MGKVLFQTIVSALVLFCLFACSPDAAQKSIEPRTINTTSVNTHNQEGHARDKTLHKVDQAVALSTQNEIKSMYADFRKAVLSHQGRQAAQYLSPSTYQYYQTVLMLSQWALSEPKMAQLAATHLGSGIRLNAAMILTRLSPQEILDLDAEKLVVKSIDNGWLGYQSIRDAQLGFFQLYHLDDQPYILVDYLPEMMFKERQISRIGFVRVTDAGISSWKIDLVPLLAAVDNAILTFAKEHQLNVSSLISDAVTKTQLATQKQWELYSYPEDEFRSSFPTRPIVSSQSDARLYHSKDLSSRQYAVLVYSKPFPSGDKQEILKKVTHSLIQGLNQFTVYSSVLPGMDLQRVDFQTPEQKGIKLVILTKSMMMFVLSCDADIDEFNLEQCNQFFGSFAPSKKLLQAN